MSALGDGARRVWIPALLAGVLAVSRPAAAQEDLLVGDSLDLEAALRLARERSPALLAAGAGVQAAEGELSVARAARRPRLSARGLYLRWEDPPTLSLGPGSAIAPLPENGYLAGLQAVQPVYTSGRTAAGVRATSSARRSAELTRAQAEVDVTASVAHAHDDALLARALEEVAERSATVLRRTVDVARARYEEGAVARLDVLRAESRLSLAEMTLREARDVRAVAREWLAATIGLDPGKAPRVAGRLAPDQGMVPEPDPDSLDALARASNPGVRSRRAAAQAARARAEAARASRRPTLSLFLASVALRPEPVTGDERWTWEVAGGVSASWPFFDGGAARGRAAAAEAQAERARAEAVGLALEVAAAARAQRRARLRALADMAAGRENVERSERALAIAEERYLDGIGIQLEVLEAEADLTGARAELLRAVHAYRSATIELKRALGLPADARLAGPEGG